MRIARAGDGLFSIGGQDLAAAGDDVVLENDRITLVVDALDQPHFLAPTGGSVLDLAPRGAGDQLNQIYVAGGILPDDAFHYTSLVTVDESPYSVSVVLIGAMDGRPGVRVATRYELRPCEPGVRAWSELHNASADVIPFFLADVAFWGGRGPLPFSPAPAQGFVQPDLDLVTLDSWGSFPYVAARGFFAGGAAYAFVPCDRATLDGVNDPQVTALGPPRTLVRPGESLRFERFLVTAPGPDVESATRLALEARSKLGHALPLTISGRVLAGGQGFGGSETRAAVQVVSRETGALVTEAIPAADGTFTATVPPGDHDLLIWSFGRVMAGPLPAAAGDIEIPAPATLTVSTSNGNVLGPALVVVVPADPATAATTRGTQQGRFTACAPWLGPPHGASPACNRVLSRGNVTFELPAGHYFVYGSRGPFAALDRGEVTLAPGEAAGVTLSMPNLPGLRTGWLSADLHVHGRASFDSSFPDEDRVLSFAAAGIDVIAATDHDTVVTYADALSALGLSSRVRVFPGVETTGLIPWMRVPGDDFPRVIGHFNFWPVAFDPAATRGGAPWDELIEPGELLDRMDAILAPGGLAMMNHPWDEPQTGRDLGYLRAIGFDPRRPIPAFDDGTPQGLVARRPAGGHANLDFQVMEVLNGRSVGKYLQYRQLWWSLLAQGVVLAGAANSDSHGMTDAQAGWPRTLLRAAAGDSDRALLDAIREGRSIGSNGVVIDASVTGDTLSLTVAAAPWIPIAEVRLYVNGALALTIDELPAAPDPFATAAFTRYTGTIPLADLMPAGGDAWLIVEAGLPLPAGADLDDDGIVDTTDNDGDGVIDLRDVEPGEDSGPLTDPPDPDPWSADPRAHLCAVEPGTWPLAFTNPFLLDLDGDGQWTAPGL